MKWTNSLEDKNSQSSVKKQIIRMLFSCQVMSLKTAAHQASLSLTISWSLPKFMSLALMMLSSHLIHCRPLLLLPSIFASIRVFSNESALRIRWPKYWSFSFSISPSNEYSGLISFRIDWFDLLAVQGTLKSLLPHHSLKTSILWCWAFFMVQLSQLYVTTGKTRALTIWMSSLFNMLSRPVIAFLPRSSLCLISWLRSPYTGDPGLIPGLRRSPGEGNGTPLQYSCLENPMDGGT